MAVGARTTSESATFGYGSPHAHAQKEGSPPWSGWVIGQTLLRHLAGGWVVGRGLPGTGWWVVGQDGTPNLAKAPGPGLA